MASILAAFGAARGGEAAVIRGVELLEHLVKKLEGVDFNALLAKLDRALTKLDSIDPTLAPAATSVTVNVAEPTPAPAAVVEPPKS